MADNIIKRIIQMVLDKESAKKVQDDANATAEGIDKAWKAMASRVAGYLGVAFLTTKILALGKAAVAEAMESQAAWADLKGTIDATGGSFDQMETKIRATADAFQDATIHDDDAFAISLSRIITLTGDAEASLQNMGLVANVAAQFFKGDLAPASDLVAKAMNGNTNALKKMGIQAGSAQEALDILAQRSMGAATREASTFAGQLKQMDEQWNDVLKTLGEAIIDTDGASDAISVLRAAIKVLGEWVTENKDEIRQWVTNGILFAIDAADVFIRAVTGMASIIKGGFMTSLGLAAQGIAKLMNGVAAVNEVENSIREALGQDVTNRKKFTQGIRDNAKALEEWGKAAKESGILDVGKGVDRLSNRLFTSDDFKNRVSKPGPMLDVKPVVGKNIVTDELKEVQKALEQYTQDTKAAANMQDILGAKFDATGAEIERITKLLNVLAANGVDPASVGMGGLAARLNDLTTNIKPAEEAAKVLAKTLTTDMAIGAITAATAVDQLKQQQNEVLNAIKTLIDSGVDPASDAVTELTDRYSLLQNAIGDATKIQNLAVVYRALGDEIRSNLFMATLDGATGLDKMKIQQQALQKAMQALLAQGIKPEQKELKDLAARYRDVTVAIKEQTTVMQVQAAAAEFLADALGTALQGGLHEAAAAKAKQNAIEAAEMLVRAGAFALFGDFPHASAALVLAGQFAGIAAAWGLLAAGTHGASGGAVPASGGGGSSSPSADLSSSRSSSSDASSHAEQPSAEVSVYLVGPGFHALNPEVQRVVWGATQEAKERFGPNVRVRTRTQ